MVTPQQSHGIQQYPTGHHAVLTVLKLQTNISHDLFVQNREFQKYTSLLGLYSHFESLVIAKQSFGHCQKVIQRFELKCQLNKNRSRHPRISKSHGCILLISYGNCLEFPDEVIWSLRNSHFTMIQRVLAAKYQKWSFRGHFGHFGQVLILGSIHVAYTNILSHYMC